MFRNLELMPLFAKNTGSLLIPLAISFNALSLTSALSIRFEIIVSISVLLCTEDDIGRALYSVCKFVILGTIS